MSDFHTQLAELVFPHVTKTPDDFQRQYPPRDLPDAAKVTRFAPSPTGFVHIGSLMTSLVDKLVARQSGGVFFLRIEDTDKKREQDRSIEEIVQNLNNFDLTPDEGAVDIDPLVEVGAYAPYLQSGRVEIYEAFAKDMIAHGNAYPCFCTEEELSRIRAEQEAAGAMPGYYGRWAKWRDASLEQVKERLDAGERPVIRIRAPYPNEARARFTDLIRGELDLPANDQDSVLVKSNTLPTYHFAHVVDDTLMRVNTIVRGEEWLPSAPLLIQTFEFLGLPLIDFAHVAPIAKMDGNSRRKLSKRKDPEANVMYYHEAGYPRQAVTEYLLNLANSGFYDWRKANPDAPAQEFPFKLGDMGVAMPLFDFVKLNDVSKDIIATYTAEQVYDYVVTWAQEFNPRLLDVLTADRDYAIRVFNVERTGNAPRKDLVNWSDVERVYSFFFDALFDPQANGGYPLPKLPADDIRSILEHIRGFDPATPKDVWLDGMRGLAEQLGFAPNAKTFKQNPGAYKGQFGDVMMVVRVALTGRTNTPDLYEILSIFGSERIGRRIEMALSSTNQP
jgi:glutamyl-tRNA synthetase